MPHCSIADDHHVGRVSWTKKHERAAKLDRPTTESILTAIKSDTALAKNAPEQNRRLLRTTELDTRIIRSEISPPNRTPKAAPNKANDESSPDFALPTPLSIPFTVTNNNFSNMNYTIAGKLVQLTNVFFGANAGVAIAGGFVAVTNGLGQSFNLWFSAVDLGPPIEMFATAG